MTGIAIGLGVGPFGGGAKTQPFSPLDLSPALWLDASDTATITASLGSVSQWDDKSGNARHAIQGTALNQPTTGSATLNGLNVIDFDGGSDVLATALATSAVNNWAIAMVWVPDTTTANRPPFYNGTGSNGYAPALGANTSTSIGLLIGGVGWTDSDASFSAGNGYAVVLARLSGTTQLWSNKVKSNMAVATSPTTPTSSSFVGARSGSTSFCDGKMAEVVVWTSPTTQQIDDVSDYLTAKWGL